MIKRVVLIVIDSVGIGAMDDAHEYGDQGSNTLDNIAKARPLNIDNLRRLGIGNIEGLPHVPRVDFPIGSFGRMKEISKGKDTITGHWELAGLELSEPFKTYPEGFPRDLIDEIERQTGHKTLAHVPASGTEIIERFGKEHMETGALILYTSADSVVQIAAHEEIIPLDELYRVCEVTRAVCMGEHKVGRIIARPFLGELGSLYRTGNRRDYALEPFGDTMLDRIKAKGLTVAGIGKVSDIYNNKGVTVEVHTKDNEEGILKTLEFMDKYDDGLIFTNLVDFDSKYGHRRNVEGYAQALESFDVSLGEIIDKLKDEDVLIITADHGNDPTHEGTDHTREYVPVLVYGKEIIKGHNLGTRDSFADLGATIVDLLKAEGTLFGRSFKGELILNSENAIIKG